MPRTELRSGAGPRAERPEIKKTARSRSEPGTSLLPSSTIFRKLISILENREYMAMIKEKLWEIKQICKNQSLAKI